MTRSLKPEEKEKMAGLEELFVFFGNFSFKRMLAFRLPMWIGKKIQLMQRVKGIVKELFTWFRREYDEHEKTWEPDNPRHFLDVYITER